VPDYRTLARPPRLAGPLVEALAATHRTRAQQARILGISRAQIQDRLSGRRGARGWTDGQLQRLAELLGTSVAEARRLVEQHRDIAVTVENAAPIGVLADCASNRDSNVAVCDSCENAAPIGVLADCCAGAAT